MEYLSHRHSDLYAGAKGQRRLEAEKQPFTFSWRPLKDEQQKGRFNHSNLNLNSKSLQRLMQ